MVTPKNNAASQSTSEGNNDPSKTNSNPFNKGIDKRNKGKQPKPSSGPKKLDKQRETRKLRQNLPNRSSQNSGSSNINKFSCNNLSIFSITEKHFNQSVILGNYRDVNNVTLPISMTIVPDNDRLIAQATVWASKIVSTQELSLRYILNSNQDRWQKDLIECFIYSYYRALLYALTDKRVAEFDGSKYGVIGHVLLYKMLLRPSFSFVQDDTTVKYEFNITDNEYDFILQSARFFPYVSDFINDGRRFSLENTIIDRHLNSLNDSFTPDEPQLENMNSDSSKILNCMTKESFPLANSFYYSRSSTEKFSKWFYSYKTGNTIFSPSSLFGKACFVTSCDDNTNSNYYETTSQDDEYYLVKYEVTALCGCSYSDYFVPKNKSKGK